MGDKAAAVKAQRDAMLAGSASTKAPKPLGTGYGEQQRSFVIERPTPALTDSQVSNPNRGVQQVAKGPDALFYESDVMRIANASPLERAQFNQALINAGLLNPDTALGSWGPKSAAAARSVFSLANQITADYGPNMPKPFYFTKALELMGGQIPGPKAKKPGGGGGGGRGAGVLPPVRLTSPEDLTAVIKDAGERVLGRRLAPEEEQQFVKFFQAKEQQFGQAAQTQAGGTITDPPTATTAAKNFATAAKPVEAAAQGVSTMLGGLEDMISRAGGLQASSRSGSAA